MSIDQIEVGSFAENRDRSHFPKQLRIVSWNVARGGQFDAVAAFLASAHADLILLQEVDRNCSRTACRNIAKELAHELRMQYVFGVEFQELAQGPSDSPAYHGQATLTPWQISSARVLRFSNQSKFWRPYWCMPRIAPLQRRVGGRMALVTHVEVGPVGIVAYNVHLESRNGDAFRLLQLRELLDDTRRYALPDIIVAAGDFNFDLGRGPQSDAVRNAGFDDSFGGRARTAVAKTFGQTQAIDCILTRGNIDTVAAEVHSSIRASDHYPLTLTLQLSQTRAEPSIAG